MHTWKEFVLFVADFQNLKRFSPPSWTPFRRCRRKSTPTAKALPRPRSGPCSRDLNRYWPRGLSPLLWTNVQRYIRLGVAYFGFGPIVRVSVMASLPCGTGDVAGTVGARPAVRLCGTSCVRNV